MKIVENSRNEGSRFAVSFRGMCLPFSAFTTLQWFGLARVDIPTVRLYRGDAVEPISKLLYWEIEFDVFCASSAWKSQTEHLTQLIFLREKCCTFLNYVTPLEISCSSQTVIDRVRNQNENMQWTCELDVKLGRVQEVIEIMKTAEFQIDRWNWPVRNLAIENFIAYKLPVDCLAECYHDSRGKLVPTFLYSKQHVFFIISDL